MRITELEIEQKKKKKTSLIDKTYSVGQRYRPHQLRCSKCKAACEDACWTQKQRENHRRRQTKLVCKACRAQGFHPRNLEAFTCQTCKGNFGSKRFNKVLLNNYKQRHQRRRVRLQCIQCVDQRTCFSLCQLCIHTNREDMTCADSVSPGVFGLEDCRA